MKRVILHCDLNSFFASVETLLNPKYRGKAMAVCGDKEQRHGIVLAKTIEAQKYGVRTAEPIGAAKAKCPGLITVSPHYKEYEKYSKRVFEIYREYSDLVETFGCDEAWIDVSGCERLFGTGYEIAEALRKRVKNETGLTISVGVSFTKPFAKLGSDMKKPDAVTVINYDNFREKVWGLNADKIIGVGEKTYNILKKYGIITLGDLANTDAAFLRRILGIAGETIWKFANGTDNTQVGSAYEERFAKSIGRGITGAKDITDKDSAWKVICRLCGEVSESLFREGYYAGGISINVRQTDFTHKSFQSAFPEPSRSFYDFSNKAMALLNNNYDWSSAIRSLTVTAINLTRSSKFIQTELSNNFQRREKIIKLEEAVNSLRIRYGSETILTGTMAFFKT